MQIIESGQPFTLFFGLLIIYIAMHRLTSFSLIFSFFLLYSCSEQESPEKTSTLILHYDTLDVQGIKQNSLVLPDQYQKRTPWISKQASNATESNLYRNNIGQWAIRYRSYDGKGALDHIWIDSDVKPSENGKEDFDDQHEDNEEDSVEAVQRIQLLVRVFPEESSKKKD